MEQAKIFTRTSPPNIPLEIQGEILPDKNLSVIDFLKFPLPPVARSSITNPDKYLSPPSGKTRFTNHPTLLKFQRN
jgi:hypothetical protein